MFKEFLQRPIVHTTEQISFEHCLGEEVNNGAFRGFWWENPLSISAFLLSQRYKKKKSPRWDADGYGQSPGVIKRISELLPLLTLLPSHITLRICSLLASLYGSQVLNQVWEGTADSVLGSYYPVKELQLLSMEKELCSDTQGENHTRVSDCNFQCLCSVPSNKLPPNSFF